MKHPLLAMACGLALLAPAAARADKMDVQLNEHMPEIVKHIKGKGYKNVGVLRFRADKGTGAHFDLGPINGNMAERVENLMVLHDSSKDEASKPAFGIIHEAGSAAMHQKIGAWYKKPDEAKKLFGASYPLAWGNSKVKADAFITGKVALTKDFKHATVTIECMDVKSAGKPVKVTEFTLDSDRHLVRDFNLPYTLTRDQKVTLARSRGKARSAEEQQKVEQKVDDVVLEQAQKQQKKQQKKEPVQPTEQPGQVDGPATPQQVGGIKLRITASGKDVTPRANTSQTGDYEIDCPAKGSEITFHLENTSDKELGVVLKVGGQNTIGEQRETAEQCRKWLVPAKKTYEIKGFYTGDKFDSLKKFVVMSKDEAKQVVSQLDDSLDLVEMYVFESNGEPKEGMTISRGFNARGMRGDVEKKARGNFQTLQKTLMKEGRWTKARGRDGAEVIVPDKEGATVKAPQEKEFPNPVEVKNMKIRIRPAGQPTQPQPPVDPPQPDKEG